MDLRSPLQSRHLDNHDSLLHLEVVRVLVLNGGHCHFSALLVEPNLHGNCLLIGTNLRNFAVFFSQHVPHLEWEI